MRLDAVYSLQFGVSCFFVFFLVFVWAHCQHCTWWTPVFDGRWLVVYVICVE